MRKVIALILGVIVSGCVRTAGPLPGTGSSSLGLVRSNSSPQANGAPPGIVPATINRPSPAANHASTLSAASALYFKQAAVAVGKNLFVTSANGYGLGATPDLAILNGTFVTNGSQVYPVVRVTDSYLHSYFATQPGYAPGGAISIDYAIYVTQSNTAAEVAPFAVSVAVGDSLYVLDPSAASPASAKVASLQVAYPAGDAQQGPQRLPFANAYLVVSYDKLVEPGTVIADASGSNLVGIVTQQDSDYTLHVLNLTQSGPVYPTLQQDLAFLQGNSDEDFIDRAYLDTLGRLPGPAEITSVEGFLRTNSRASLIPYLTNSVEGRTYAITSLYQQYLGRQPDAQGLAFFLDLLGTHDLSVARTDILSATATGGDDRTFLNNLYSDVLALTPSPSELNAGMASLAGITANRLAFTQNFVNDPRAQVDRIEHIFARYLRRPAGQSEVAAILSTLVSQGEGAVTLSVLESPEYTEGIVPNPASLSVGQVSPSHLTVAVGSPAGFSVPFTNTGSNNVFLTVTADSGLAVVPLATPNNCLPGGNPPAFTLLGGQSCTLTVQFQSQAAGTFSPRLTLNDGTSSPAAQVTFDVTVTAPPAPNLVTNPYTLNFNGVPLNNPVSLPLTLTNGGTAAAQASAQIAAPFSVTNAGNDPGCNPSSLSIPPGGSCRLNVGYTASHAGSANNPDSASLMVTYSSGVVAASVAVSGYGQAPAALSFTGNFEIQGGTGGQTINGTLYAAFNRGQSATVFTTVINNGSVPSLPTAVNFTLIPSPAGFQIPSVQIPALNPGESRTISANVPFNVAGQFTLDVYIVNIYGEAASNADERYPILVN